MTKGYFSLVLTGLLVGYASRNADRYQFDRYQIDGDQTYAGFTVKHLGVSTVHGEFKRVSGTFTFDGKDCATFSANARLRSSSIHTDDEMRDERLLSDEFLDAQHYRFITFNSKRTEEEADHCVAIGDLTIRNITREVAIPFTWASATDPTEKEKRLRVQGGVTINRHDYGLRFDGMMDRLVGQEVTIILKVEAIQ